ncbi:MAG: sugar kinase [Solimonas sp.]
MDAIRNRLVLVTRRSRLEELVARFNTIEQARFYVEHLGADFGDYEAEHRTCQAVIRQAEEVLGRFGRVQRLDRSFLSNFIFPPGSPVIVIGQDGLVANTLKYLDGQPVIGVNPDPQRWDGVLLPFQVADLEKIVPEVQANRRADKGITMAQVSLADGQTLYAVNDFFVGARSHVSARYEIRWQRQAERHSSSGVIVSTGLGSSGWFRSILTGAAGIAGDSQDPVRELQEQGFAWDADYLYFSVREPFPSKWTQVGMVFGQVSEAQPLELVSGMAENGVIFSDGIESDFLEFNAGTKARFGPASRQGRLVC